MSDLRVTSISDRTGTGPVDLVKQSAAKAWSCVNHSPFAVRDSFNVSSAADVGVGLHDVNFTNAMTSFDYSSLATSNAFHTADTDASRSVNKVRIGTYSSAHDPQDITNVSQAVHGDLA